MTQPPPCPDAPPRPGQPRPAGSPGVASGQAPRDRQELLDPERPRMLSPERRLVQRPGRRPVAPAAVFGWKVLQSPPGVGDDQRPLSAVLPPVGDLRADP